MGYIQDKTGVVYVLDDDVKPLSARNILAFIVIINWLSKKGIENGKIAAE